MAKNLSKKEMAELDCSILEFILTGKSRTEIVRLVNVKYPKLPEAEIIKLYDNNCEHIAKKTATSAKEIIALHVSWYEDLYEKFDRLDCVPGKVAALRQKEKILGLLKDQNVIAIDNEINVNANMESKYDMNKLTLEERKRLERYLSLTTCSTGN